MEEKPPRDVPFQDTTADSLGLNSKVPETREYSGKASPILSYTSLLGTFRNRINIASSKQLSCPCMAILVDLGPFVPREILQCGCSVEVYLVHSWTKSLLIGFQSVCMHGLLLDTVITQQLLLGNPIALFCCLLLASNRVSLVQQLSIFCY